MALIWWIFLRNSTFYEHFFRGLSQVENVNHFNDFNEFYTIIKWFNFNFAMEMKEAEKW